jgi:hypothetical protein
VARTTPQPRRVERWTPAVIPIVFVCLTLTIHDTQAQQAPTIPRVRSENPVLSAAIVEGAKRSTVFRRLIEAIDATDGLVYVLEGRCGQGVRACLHMSLELSGKNRLLRILVSLRRASGCELIARSVTNCSTLSRRSAIRTSGLPSDSLPSSIK